MLKVNKISDELEYERGIQNDEYVEVGEKTYLLQPLRNQSDTGKGKNSLVFLGVDSEGKEDIIIKFCKYHSEIKLTDAKKRFLRFEREIEAMLKAYEEGLNSSILEIFDSGSFQVGGKTFLYYGMEEAELDLTDYLTNEDPPFQERLDICASVADSLSDLNKIGIYHRDLKPDNIFYIDGRFKIGDLGFMAYRDKDISPEIEDRDDRIGPTARMSPEACNRKYGRSSDAFFGANTEIDEASDIYQLGSIFWYVFQGEIATGLMTSEDFRHSSKDIFERMIKPALAYDKVRRITHDLLRTQISELTNILA